ncbi:MAG TPA: hypothetical protein P5064_00625 [Clostridia bacterium]|jgi:hypothetical protein|nr:MAG: hypothetical protein BWX78_00171 [Firmicutes bacterium ADurb.Bin099]HHT95305.1 hypothetical protein [Clostridiaceae bacterium]HNZ40279.1 hypothetical protein [Clostridia bacterium]HOF26827.1 hypothetical protein [Clostridia bacterium]HOM33892.1 hypothetical protein [Clostridia bacterium]
MLIYGKLIKNNLILVEEKAECVNPDMNFQQRLTNCLVDICKKMDIQVPVWMSKNTKELARFNKTFFTDEQFMEKVYFDRFEIEMKRKD